MIEIKNSEYRASVNREGLLQVWAERHPFVKQVYKSDGSVEVHTEPTTKSERTLYQHLSRTPVFAAGYGKIKKSKGYWVDREAGVCRQNDVFCSGKEIGGALRNCQFSKKEINQLLSRCRRHQWDHCPRQA